MFSLSTTLAEEIPFLPQHPGDHVYIPPFLRPRIRFSLITSRTSRFLPAHLNRQLITILSSLGIHDHVFLEYQEKMLE
jgi:hypothetical protein